MKKHNKLNVGCGQEPTPGFDRLDIDPRCGDLNYCCSMTDMDLVEDDIYKEVEDIGGDLIKIMFYNSKTTKNQQIDIFSINFFSSLIRNPVSSSFIKSLTPPTFDAMMGFFNNAASIID